MNKRKSKRAGYEIEDLGVVELPAELDAKIQQMTKAAETDLDATRVNFRWQREPLRLVKTVASAMGVPYQTYMKQVLYRQALEDIGKIHNTLPPQKQQPSTKPASRKYK